MTKGSTNVGSALMVLSGWVTSLRAPSVKSFQSKSGAVRLLSSRNVLSGWNQPDFQARRFSTCMLACQASTPPLPAVISTVNFCRPCTSGSTSYFALIPVSDSNSGICFTISSTKGCL